MFQLNLEYAFLDLVEKLGWFQQAPFENLKFQIWKFKNLPNFSVVFQKTKW